MAVQAQYPSNVLLLNRNVQEVKEMLAGEYPMQSLQSHQTSGYLDQTNMFFLNGGGAGSSSRKRGREAPINLFSLQSQPPPPTLVNLAQLHTPPPAPTPAPAPASAAPATCVVSTGLGLSLQDHQQEQQLGLAKPSSSHLPSSLLDDLAAEINQQNEDIDQFLRAQADQLRRALTERYRALLGAAESARQQLRRKEAEVETAARRRAELEERVERMEAEVQARRARARAQEAAAAALQVQLRQAMSTAATGSWPAAGEQDGGEEPGCAAAEDAESAHVDPDRVEVVAGAAAVPPTCRVCRRRYMSVVLMPCRHLCVCEECESVVRTCPICRVPSSGGVKVYL